MKGLLPHMLFCAVLLTVCATAAQAQDAGMSDVEIVDDANTGSKIIYAPGEDLRYVPQGSAVVKPSDSVYLQIQDFPMQRATTRPPEDPSSKESEKSKDESILTFNFLYYILQKYKLQDIID